MAQPTKLTPDRQAILCDTISAGNYYEAACALAGIEYRTFRNWMERGQQETSGRYVQFFHAVIRAEAEAEARVVASWQARIPEDWQAARDFLARRHPDRWGPKDKHQITGADNGPQRIVVEYADAHPDPAATPPGAEEGHIAG